MRAMSGCYFVTLLVWSVSLHLYKNCSFCIGEFPFPFTCLHWLFPSSSIVQVLHFDTTCWQGMGFVSWYVLPASYFYAYLRRIDFRSGYSAGTWMILPFITRCVYYFHQMILPLITRCVYYFHQMILNHAMCVLFSPNGPSLIHAVCIVFTTSTAVFFVSSHFIFPSFSRQVADLKLLISETFTFTLSKSLEGNSLDQYPLGSQTQKLHTI